MFGSTIGSQASCVSQLHFPRAKLTHSLGYDFGEKNGREEKRAEIQFGDSPILLAGSCGISDQKTSKFLAFLEEESIPGNMGVH
jgi:hypothetical protein